VKTLKHKKWYQYLNKSLSTKKKESGTNTLTNLTNNIQDQKQKTQTHTTTI